MVLSYQFLLYTQDSLCHFTGVTGILVTYFFVPDMTGVDLADEDAKFMQYLASNGWEGVVGEDDDKELITAGESDSGKD